MNTIYYTNGVSTIRIPENQEPPIGYWRGRTFKSNPWNKGLTKESSKKSATKYESCTGNSPKS